MSFLSDLFQGNFSNLGQDLAPSNIFSDFGTDASKALSNPIVDAGLLVGGGLLTAGLADPALLGLGAAGGAVDAAGAGAAGADLGAAAASAPLDLTAFGADTAADAALPSAATLDAGEFGALANPALTAAGAAGGASPGALVASDFATLGAGVGSPLDITAGAGAAAGAANPAIDITAGAGAAAGAANPAIAGAGGGVLDSITGALAPVGTALKTAAPILGVAGLGATLYTGYEQKQALNALNQQEATNAATAASISATDQAAAAPLLTSGQTLMQYLTTNTLPPQFQASVTQQVQAQKAQIIQGYASRGMSTDPNQNSGLAQDLANVDVQAQTLQANLESTLSTAGNQMVTTANQLLNSGLSATQLSAELPIQVAQLNSTLNAQMAQAISGFAAALNGGGTKSGITLTLPQNIVGSSGNLQNLNG